MRNGRRLMEVLAAVGIGWSASWAVAAPWEKLLSIQRVEADPQKPYTITEQNGPWMIMACSFSATKAPEQARQQAHELALELRKRYKLPAYVYDKKFDLGKEVYGRGVDEFGRPRRMKYNRGVSEIEEIAVLVGDYPAVDDPEAQETLRKIKYCEPECLKVQEGKPTTRNLAAMRAIQRALLSAGNEKKNKGPMGHAFITTNPLLPDDFIAPKGLDELVLKANEGVEHCLLDCPGKYTVQVATFTGRVIIDQKEIQRIRQGKEMESQLAEAALKAHELTKALRIKGYDAYEFHDRSASIVTVGSFGSVGPTRADGVIELDPRIQATIDRFKGELKVTPEYPRGVMVPQRVIGISLDAQPLVVHVPKRSANALVRHQANRAK